MPPIRIWQVDAFTNKPFSGNPAAVCLLERAADEAWMQAVAAEMNLAETAFVYSAGDHFELRWFTPVVEVDLCGHATLATAHVLWSSGAAAEGSVLRFGTCSGELRATKAGELIELDFPATPAEPAEAPAELLAALGLENVLAAGKTRFDWMIVADSEAAVRGLEPDFRGLAGLPVRGVMVTARADDKEFDFVSRFFGPGVGIDEDPVTGSAHCCLGPYWAEQLGKNSLVGLQCSARSGVVHVKPEGDRVKLGGQAVTVLRGELV